MGRRGFGAWMLTNKHTVQEQPVPPYNDVIGPCLPPLRMALYWELENGELIFPFSYLDNKAKLTTSWSLRIYLTYPLISII